ncbi:MAG: dihydroorotate dehydrogenase [Candidatus Bathyarchaeota archaeon]|nr:dihydroorotate dehydrogenase [Candidatus Bathyarchaeota archaeon]
METSLATQIGDLKLANPTMLAAGILGYTGLSMKTVIDAGAGAVVTKTMGLEPRKGYLNPTVVQTDCGLLNAMGLPNPGIHHFKSEMGKLKKTKAPTIVSIYGFSANEYAQVARKAQTIGADAVELNVSCPHVEKAGAQIGSDPQLLSEIVEVVADNVTIPVIVKLTPNVTNITEIAKVSQNAGADAITAINTLKAMAIDTETGRPILANKFGGLSGPAIKPIALRCVYDIYNAVDIPVIGCGGISNWQDAVQFIQAGASALQIGTAVAFQGLDVFSKITKGVEKYLKSKGFSNIKELVGYAHQF